MIKKSAQTFSTASWKKSWDQHETFRFIWQFLSGRHRNKYSLTLKEFNCISQSYQSSLSYIVWWSDFQANDLQRVQLLTETVLQYSTLMLSSRRGHFINVSDNICGYLCGFSLQMPFQDRKFFAPFQTVLQAFLYLWEEAVHRFSRISKTLFKKNSMMESRFINVAMRHI